jgi:hypothetical protein
MQALALAVGMAIAAGAQATTTAAISNLTFEGFDANGRNDSVFAFTGADTANSYAPPVAFPPFWTSKSGGYRTGTSPFGDITSEAEFDYQGMPATTLLANWDAATGTGGVYVQGEAPGHGEADLLVGGTFTLAPHSVLEINGTVVLDLHGGEGSVGTEWTLDGVYSRADYWFAQANAPYSVVITNRTDSVETGGFGASFWATNVPEPADAAMLLAGLALIGATSRRRRSR